MTRLALLIDIQTIIKMVKMNESFQDYFKKLSFWNDEHKRLIDEYIITNNTFAKETIWGMLSTVDYIPEVNFIISLWRRENENYKELEEIIEFSKESKYGHSVIGKVIKFDNISDKYRKLIKEEKNQNFYYNGFKIIPNGKNDYLQLFY
jgi:hypothetical protein